MNNPGFVIIWHSTFSNARGVEAGVYHNETTANDDCNKLNRKSYESAVYKVVEFNSPEHHEAATPIPMEKVWKNSPADPSYRPDLE
jgi:hypothetical protein